MTFLQKLASVFKSDSPVIESPKQLEVPSVTPVTLDVNRMLAEQGMQFSTPNNYGSWGLVDASRPGPERPYEPLLNFDFDRLVSPYDLAVLRSASRKLMYNLGPARSAIIQKANYSFGKAWRPKFIGDDTEWGSEAKALLEEEFYPLCDVRGPSFDFVTGLHLDSITMDKDGDVLIVCTEDEDGYPQFVRVLAHRIMSGDIYEGLVKTGPYSGHFIWNGVIRNDDGRPVAYRIQVGGDQGWTDSKFVDVSSQDCIFVCDPDSADQIRGLPALTPAIEDLLDLRHTQKFEKQAQMLAAAIGLIETNEPGGPVDFKSLAIQATKNPAGTLPAPPGVTFQDMFGGLIKYFRAGTGGKIETLLANRPTNEQSAFMDRLIRNSCAAIDWPYELAWNPSGLSSTNSRLVISQAMRSVEDRQGLMRPIAKRMVCYAISKYIALGRIRESKDWNKWEFTIPQKLSVDQGRDRSMNNKDYCTGLLNYTDILSEKGEELETKLYERALEVAMRKLIAKEVGEEYGVEILDTDMAMLTPNGNPAGPMDQQGGDGDGSNMGESNPDNPKNT